jgi:hypothetical protein
VLQKLLDLGTLEEAAADVVDRERGKYGTRCFAKRAGVCRAATLNARRSAWT